jgi:hypothetical protein
MRHTRRARAASELEFDETKSHRPRSGAFDPAVGSDDAMRGNEKIDRGCGHRGGDAAMRERIPDRARNVRIRDEFTERKRRHGAPDVDLKCGAGERKRQIEPPQPPGEVGPNLCGGFGEQSVARLASRGPPSGNERAADDPSIVAHDH